MSVELAVKDKAPLLVKTALKHADAVALAQADAAPYVDCIKEIVAVGEPEIVICALEE